MKNRARTYIKLFVSAVYEHDPSKDEKAEAIENLVDAARRDYRLERSQIDILPSDVEVYDTTPWEDRTRP